MMRFLDVSLDDPAENLALDELLLGEAEAEDSEGILRFWESPVRFVVIGTSQALSVEVHEAHCRADGVPVLRRCTAGGCVLQGPGSLNFSLALPFSCFPEAQGIHASYSYILERICQVLEARGVPAGLAGICDIAVAGRKVSGNAQRRRSRAILHHGTLLHAVDYPAMARYLREPEDRPEYRGGRVHEDFVAALPLGPGNCVMRCGRLSE